MKKEPLKRLLKYCLPYKMHLVGIVILSSIQIIFTLLIPIYIGKAVDTMIGVDQVDFTLLIQRMICIGSFMLISALSEWCVLRLSNRLTYAITKDLRNDLLSHYIELPLKVVDQYANGDLISRVVNDIDLVGDGILQGFTHLFGGIATIIGTICFMLYINVTIAMIVILLTPLSLVVASVIASKTYKYFQIQLSIRGQLNGYVEEMVGHQKVIKAFGHEEENKEHFDELNEQLYRSGVKSQFFGALVNPSTRIVNSIVYASVAMGGALYVVSGNMSVGILTSFLSYANQYTKPFNEISGVFTELQTAVASAARVFELLDRHVEQEVDSPIQLEGVRGEITFDRVYFSYEKEQKLIEDFNLHVNPGQMVAIVGPTGCGKTTLINLLMRFYDTVSGTISIDGVPIQDISRHDLRSYYGMVLQESWLFTGTIRDNIAYGSQASEEEIIEAAKKAHAHNFIAQLKDGYDTFIHEDGGNLSQGQKQLLCISRIMLKNSPILILDEATSSIDTRTEKQIQDAFDVMMKGRTSFVVAHRLSTIRQADVILVMKDGHIIEKGTHDELLKQNGFYNQLYTSQFEKEKD